MGLIKGIHQKLEPQYSADFFGKGVSPFARLVFFAALSLTLMALDSRFNSLNKLRASLVSIVHPLEVIANTPSNWYLGLTTYFSSHHTLLKDNAALKAQAFQQSVALQRLTTVEAENKHLRSLLNANPAPKQISTLAEIIHMERDPFTHKVLVNRGSAHGIVAGQAVVDAAGVIGQVTRVYAQSSEVTLVIDKGLSIPIQIERNNLRAIAFGQGHDSAINLPYLPANVDIIQGDKLITSGIDGIYPAGLAIAVVVKIERTPDSPFANIVCAPLAGVNKHKQVLLLSVVAEPIVEPISAKRIGTTSGLKGRAALKAAAIGTSNALTSIGGIQKSATPLNQTNAPKQAIARKPEKLPHAPAN